MSRNHFSRMLLVCAAALGLARDVRAQSDLDILSRTVPPIVIIQFDSSGSMKNAVLPDQYLKNRGNGNPANWFNRTTNNGKFPSTCVTTVTDPNAANYCFATTMPASFLDTAW